MQRIKRGDQVIIIAGKDKGKTGEVKSVLKDKGRVVVEGINLVKKHVKANPQRDIKGGIEQKEASLHLSNVMLFDSSSNQRSRVGYRTLEDGKKVRFYKASNEVVDQ